MSIELGITKKKSTHDLLCICADRDRQRQTETDRDRQRQIIDVASYNNP